MSTFTNLQKEHDGLLSSHLSGNDVTEDVQKYIITVQRESANVSNASDREQLRANLRYWASYLYEKTGKFPSVELSPVSISNIWTMRIVRFGGIILLVLILLFCIAASSQVANYYDQYMDPLSSLRTNTYQVQMPSTWTLSPLMLSITPLIKTNTETPTHVTALTPALTLTQLQIFTPAPIFTPSPISRPSGILVEITNPQSGDSVSPETIVSGIYQNLQPGWSIYVIVQPVSMGGLMFPVENTFTIPERKNSGEWFIPITLGKGSALLRPETYILQAVIANNQLDRDQLNRATVDGLRELPDGIIPLPSLTTITRQPYKSVTGLRLIYSESTDGNFDIVSRTLNGNDFLKNTDTLSVSELQASISPDGKRIAYIGRRRDINFKPSYAVEIIDSNGQNVVTIAESQQEFIYESPVWSSDQKYLAYAIGYIQEPNPTFWSIRIYDLENSRTITSLTDNYSLRYPTWIPNSHKLIFTGRVRSSGTAGLFSADLDNPSANGFDIFFDSGLEEFQGAVSPDGKSLVLLGSDETKKLDLYLVNLESNEITQFTDTSLTENYPNWYPDGSAIYYWTQDTDNFNIWKYSIIDHTIGTLHESNSVESWPYIGFIDAYIPFTP